MEGIFANRLYRSGHLHGATGKDVEALRDIGFGLIVDLRRPRERAAAPAPDLGIDTIASDLAEHTTSPHVGFLEAGDLRPEAVQAYLLGYYQAAPFTAHFKPLVAGLLDALGQGERPVLVHCTAGKDRTGLAVAIAQSIAGASRQSVLVEFMRSNKRLVDPQFREQARAQILSICGRGPTDALIEAFAGVQAGPLEAALDAIHCAGGMNAYVAGLRSLNRDAAR
ncbi:hypothetical protein YP76_20405 [Sphingobium chungbukense]|uniref:Tyrosine specific protein phosphatases domain-containing protein n=1 Tax=Sphingobium chungbukense TaxID=56193 RepID=A0A0M3AKJ0_9SPHN|nr:hypothetical protein YP76_20405 [Sphingobium chungbukense]